MLKKAFLHAALTITYAIGMVLKILGNIFLGLAEKIMLSLQKG